MRSRPPVAALLAGVALATVGVATTAPGASHTRCIGLAYGGNADMNRNLERIDDAFCARPTTTTTTSPPPTTTTL